MKKLYQFSFLIAFILLFSVNSCKKEDKNPIPVPGKNADTHVLPEEINAWFDKMPQVKPSATLLAAAQQSVINGVQVVRIPVAYNAALYFTKENDSLKVYAYKWVYESLDAQKYTGYIDAYNFQNQNLNRLVYTNGTLTNTLLLAHYTNKATNVSSNGQLKLSECWVTDLFNAIWDWITGAFSGSGSSSNGGDFSSYMNSYGYSASNYSGLGFTSGGGGGGGSAWGPPPCPPSAPQQEVSTKLKVNKYQNDPTYPPPAPGCVVVNNSQWQTFLSNPDNLDTYTGDEINETSDNNTNDNGPTAHVPSTITLDNGKTVSVVFGTTQSDGLSADQAVSVRLINTLIQALNIASKQVTITSIYIKATTNGTHSNSNSNHYKGLALDISRINGTPMIVSGSTDFVQQLQIAFDQSSNIRENFGPFFKHKFGQLYLVPGHGDHIHVSINGN